MSTDHYLLYRGDVKALAFVGGRLVFVTVHPEGQPTPVYRLNPEDPGVLLEPRPLPAGGVQLLAVGEEVWIAGSDRQVYRASSDKNEPIGAPFDTAPVALALLAAERLAVAAGSQVFVLARGDGTRLQTLELPEPVTCLASDPTGQWLAAGTVKGTVAVFECESEPAEFRLSDSGSLHEAAVTALLFEADELRFLSAGADQKLLSTHARGRLEAEDRGRGTTHEQPITALVAGPHDRFFTASADATLKSWPHARGARPVTLKDGVGNVLALTVVTIHGKPQLAAARTDNTLRFFPLDEEGKFTEAGVRLLGANDWARHELAESDPKRRQTALQTLAGFADIPAFERLAEQMKNDPDHELRLLACRLLGEATHPRAARELEAGLKHPEEAVRILAFESLRRCAAADDLHLAARALEAEQPDMGVRAVQLLEGRAGKDDQALARLIGALQSSVSEVRRAALASLEKIHDRHSPEASLTALGSPHADLRKLALLRLRDRKLLNDPRVQLALRWRGDDPDPEVRRVAFLLSLYTREKLLPLLRERDAELNRQLTELEGLR